MNKVVRVVLALGVLAGCGGQTGTSPKTKAVGSESPGVEQSDNRFRLGDSRQSGQSEHHSMIAPTETEAAVKFVVVDKDQGPVEGVVIALADSQGRRLYTDETDQAGYTEVLVPAGKKYDLVYLSLGRKDIVAQVDVPNEPKLTLNLTLRYQRWVPEAQPKATPLAPQPSNPPPPTSTRFVLKGVEFDSGKAVLRPESKEKLGLVVEYMTHKKSTRLEISGHTDNVGKANANLALSKRRAESVRDYLVSQGIDATRVEAVGYGDTMPLTSNDTEEGRQRNRRIEATEL